MTLSCHDTTRHLSQFLQLVIRDSQYCCLWIGKRCRKKDFSQSSKILFPALLLISSKRHEGLAITELHSGNKISVPVSVVPPSQPIVGKVWFGVRCMASLPEDSK
ncbi:hypothetical protein NPIL_181541 [Nephila pilipes]|uniref:Uncharacterized protein n=1 Tax=Nephila pilipes TaxID=299642 RepID=A0A8X6U1G7_NEPPI|nr:hypothetical protein NPIL_181541 [Nephila pilipes]